MMRLVKRFVFSKLCCSLLVTGSVLSNTVLLAQDKIILKQGAPVEGEIQSIDKSGNILLKEAQGVIPYPKAMIDKLEMGERPDYVAGIEAINQQDYAKGIEKLKPLIDKFMGLDVAWVAEGAGYMAEALAKTGKTAASEELCDKIIASYPGSQYRLKGMIGKANTLIVREKPDDALKMLEEVEKSVEAGAVPDPKTMTILSDLNFVRGQAQLKKGDKAGALECFIKVATLYYKPAKRAQEAQALADQMRKEDPALTVN